MKIIFLTIIIFIAIASICGCANKGHSVVAATATTIGLSIGQDAAKQGVETVLGYKRGEFTYVPTNRDDAPDAGDTHNGAPDTANVLMELFYGGASDGNIYQRLAVGDLAVTQGGAAALFIRGADGKLDENAAAALSNIQSISTDPNAAFDGKKEDSGSLKNSDEEVQE